MTVVVRKLNAVIIGTIVVVLIVGMVRSNTLVSLRYGTTIKKQQLNNLNVSIAVQQTELGGSNDMHSLVSLSERLGMVAGNNGETLFVTSGVALNTSNVTTQKRN